MLLAFGLAVTSAGHVVLTASDHFLLKYGGVFALLALTGSVCMGVVAADRIVMTPGHRVLAQAVHRAVSFGALAFLIIHIVLEIAAPHLEESQTQHVHILDAFIPFLSQYRTFYMAEGTIASDIIVLLVITGIIRRRFTAGGHAWKWRIIHYSSYAALILGVLHGLLAGRKAIGSFVYWSYGIVIVLVALAVLVRILATSLSSREVVRGASPHSDPGRGGDSMSTRAAALGLMGQLTGTMPLAGPNQAVAGAGLGAPGAAGLGSAGLGAAGALTAPLAGAPWAPAEPPVSRAIAAAPSAAPARPGPVGPGGPRAAGGPGADGRPPRYEPGYVGPPRYEGAPAPQPGRSTGPQPVYDTGPQPSYDTGSQPGYRADPYDRRGTGPQPAIAPGPRRPDPTGRPSRPGPGTGPIPRVGTGPIPRVGTGPIPRVGPGPAPQPGTGPIPRVGPGPQPGGPGTGPLPRMGTGPQPGHPNQAGGFAPRPPAPPAGPPPGYPYPVGPDNYRRQDPYRREPYRPDGYDQPPYWPEPRRQPDPGHGAGPGYAEGPGYGPPSTYPGQGGYRDDRDYGPGQDPYASGGYESAPPYDTEHPYAAAPYEGYPPAQGYGAPPPPPGSGYPGPPQGPPRPGRRRPDHPSVHDGTEPLPRVPSYGGDERR
ncbi:MAG TPA: hypothetical protein VH089_13570 [Streptosporangiaceae bacterium]|nr:hypothetical protein [Streptosporangiaceae bacterium]